MLEMIIVIIILGVFLTLTVPRLGGQQRRQFMLGVDQVTDFLSMFAYREQLGQRAIAIEYNGESNTFFLLVRDNEAGDPLAPSVWTYDRLVEPVKLPPQCTVASVMLDGVPIDAREFQVVTKPNEERPLIEMTLQSQDFDMMTLVLLPHAVAPKAYTTASLESAPRQAVDLDASGRSREDW